MAVAVAVPPVPAVMVTSSVASLASSTTAGSQIDRRGRVRLREAAPVSPSSATTRCARGGRRGRGQVAVEAVEVAELLAARCNEREERGGLESRFSTFIPAPSPSSYLIFGSGDKDSTQYSPSREKVSKGKAVTFLICSHFTTSAARTESGVRPPRVPVDGDEVPLVAPLGQLPLQLLPRHLLPLHHPLLVVLALAPVPEDTLLPQRPLSWTSACSHFHHDKTLSWTSAGQVLGKKYLLSSLATTP